MVNNIENWCKDHPQLYKFICELGFLVFMVVILLIVFKVFAPIGHLDNDGLVIGFIGILATFIVIGNFSQISRIESDIKTELGTLRDRLESCEEKSKQIDTLSETVRTHTTNIDSIKHNMEEASKPIDKLDLAHLLKLFVGKEGDVRKYMQLYAKMLDDDSWYHVELVDGKTMTIKIIYDDNIKDIVFSHSAKEDIEAIYIKKISGLTFNHDDLLFAYQLLHSIAVTDKDTSDDDKIAYEISEFTEETKNDHKEVQK